MKTTLHQLNQPNDALIELGRKIQIHMETFDGIPSDSRTKQIIGECIPYASKPDYQNAAMRMDFISNEIGIVCCMGTTATLSRRLLASIHYHSQDMIEGVVMIAHSYTNTVNMANRGRIKKIHGNGNRASTQSLMSTISALGTTFSCPIIILEIQE